MAITGSAAIMKAVAGGRAEIVRELVDTAIEAQNDEIEVSVLVAKTSENVRPALEELSATAVDRRAFLEGLVGGILGGAATGASEGLTGWFVGSDRDDPTIVNDVVVETPPHGDVVSRAEGDALWSEMRRLAEALEKKGRRKRQVGP